MFELGDGKVIDAGRRGNAARWINHSCDPNCQTFEDEDGRVYIEARRRISAGEELTYDYLLSWEGRVTRKIREAFTCRCGTRRCKGRCCAKSAPDIAADPAPRIARGRASRHNRGAPFLETARWPVSVL